MSCRTSILLFIALAAICSVQARVLVSNFNSNSVAAFEPDGTSLGLLVAEASGGLNLPHRSRIAPNGTLLVASAGSDQLLSYHANTGAFLGEFVSSTAGLDYPVDMVFRPDGYLYVSSQLNDQILRFDSTTGIRDMAWSAANAALDGPSGMAFASDGTFYVSGRFSNNVIQFGADGSFIRSFGSVSSAFGMVLREDGSLLVSAGGSNEIVTFTNLTSETPLQSVWASGLNFPVGIEADGAGSILVAQYSGPSIAQFDANGSFIETFTSGAPLAGPNFLTVIPEPRTGILIGGVCMIWVLFRFRRRPTNPVLSAGLCHSTVFHQ